MPNLTYFWKKKTILSFIAVIFVVAIHNSATNQYSVPQDSITDITTFIRNFFAYDFGAIAVPFFFLIAGVAFFRNYQSNLYIKKLRSRFKTLFIPFIIWNTIGLLFTIIYTYTPLSEFISGRESFSPSVPNILEGIFFYKYNFQFWFLYDLIIYVLLTPIFHFLLSKKWPGLIFVGLSLLLPLFFTTFLGLNLYFLVFYVLGCYIGKHHLSFFIKQSSKSISIISLSIFIISLIIKLLYIYNIISLPVIFSQLLLIITLVSFWFATDLFLPKLKNRKFTSEFFPIYAIHTYILAIIIKIIFFLLPETSFSLLINEVFSTIITVIIATTLAYFWHQKLPKSYSIMFGARK